MIAERAADLILLDQEHDYDYQHHDSLNTNSVDDIDYLTMSDNNNNNNNDEYHQINGNLDRLWDLDAADQSNYLNLIFNQTHQNRILDKAEKLLPLHESENNNCSAHKLSSQNHERWFKWSTIAKNKEQFGHNRTIVSVMQ